MFQTVSTNVAGILTIIGLWSSLTGLVVYVVMGNKIDRLAGELRAERWLRNRAEAELMEIDDKYGHVIDDYIEFKEEL